jgi:hypothetical protein
MKEEEMSLDERGRWCSCYSSFLIRQVVGFLIW